MYLCINVNAQITLEHIYPLAGFFFDPNLNIEKQLVVVHLEVDGDKFVHIDRANKEVVFYNLDHSFWKSINYSAATDKRPTQDIESILYISQHLFDLDNEVEFFYTDSWGSDAVVEIVNEDGTILFSVPQCAFVKVNAPQQQVPIYNSTNGTKMILSGAWVAQTQSLDSAAYVYSLTGTLTNKTKIFSDPISGSIFSNIYPNPTSGFTNIQYSLPAGVKSGQLIIFDTNGKEIKRITVDSRFENIQISTTDFLPGTYYYVLETSKGRSEGKKVISIE